MSSNMNLRKRTKTVRKSANDKSCLNIKNNNNNNDDVSLKSDTVEDDELVDMGVKLLPSENNCSDSEIEIHNEKQITNNNFNKSTTDKGVQANSLRSRRLNQNKNDGYDVFSKFSDEIVLMIMQYLPKHSLAECAQVCRRWRRIVYDESLWIRIDLSGRTIRPGYIKCILQRNPRFLKMTQTEIQSPVFKNSKMPPYHEITKLEYLDLGMTVISSKDLAVLLSRFKDLKKLSLEHCIADNKVCKSISNNKQLEALNLSLCYELNSVGLMYIFNNCISLKELNVQWTKLNDISIDTLCNSINSDITSLCLAGCGSAMKSRHVKILLNRCEQLLELDLSDCVSLSDDVIHHLLDGVPNLITLSLSRCYGISPVLYSRLIKKPSLKFLNIFGLISDAHIELLEMSTNNVKLNRIKFSYTARPTVGIRRTSIWGHRIRESV